MKIWQHRAQLAPCQNKVKTSFTVIFLHLTYKLRYISDARLNTSLTASCSVLYTLCRISVNAVVTICIFQELMRLSNAVVTLIF